MKTSLKRIIAMAIVAMMAVTFMVPQAYASPKSAPPGHSKGKANWKIGFKDVDEDKTLEWAWQAIDKMFSKGIILGYGDGIFKPKNNVTHLEAIIMAMRVMGWEEEAKSKRTLPNEVSSIKVSWKDAYYYIALAVEKGIVKPEELRNFNPDVPAKRYEVARYIVRAIDQEREAQKNMNKKLPFRDANAIPKDAVGYVYIISDMGLMIGDNNNLFKPNSPITRAEMAMLLARLDDAVEEEKGNKLIGTVVALDQDRETITIENSYGKVRYDVMPGAPVYFEGKYRYFEDINIGDEVELVLNQDEEVVFIQVIEASRRVITTSKGLVTEVDTKENTLSLYTSLRNLEDAFVGTVRLSRIEGFHYELDTAEGRYVLEGSIRDLEDYIGKNVVVVGKVKSQPSIFMRGDILEVQNIYQVRDRDVITIKVDKNTKVTLNGRSTTLSRITPGLLAEVRAEGDKAVEVKAQTIERSKTEIREVKGLVTEVDAKNNAISLYTAVREKDFAKTFIGTLRLNRIEGVHFELQTDAGRYVLTGSVDEVDSDIDKYIGKKIVVQGKILEDVMSIYMRGPLLEVENFELLDSKDVTTLKVDRDTRIILNGKAVRLSNLTDDLSAIVKAEGDLALEVEAKTVEKATSSPEPEKVKEVKDGEIEGKIVSVNSKRITIENRQGKFTFELGSKVKFDGFRRLSELKAGSKVELEIKNGKVVEIELD